MLEFLNEYYYNENGFEGEITGFDPKTKLVTVKSYNKDEKDTLKLDIFEDFDFNFNIDYHKDWEHRLYEYLNKNNKATIFIISTESGEEFTLEIIRYETEIPETEYSSKISVINYAVTYYGEIEGEILAKQYKSFGNIIEKEKDFTKWIDNQIKDVPQFNNTDYWDTFNSIVLSDAFNTDEEIKIIYDMWNKKFYNC